MVDLCYSWSDPPIDILCEVTNRLAYEDLVRFAAVCKSWRVIIYRVHLQQRSPLGMPYLMSYILCEVASRLPYEDLVRFAASKPALVLYNPFTNEITQLPQLNSSTNSVRKATFTSPPTCPDCVVLVLFEEEEEGCIIGTCKPGDKIWRFRKTVLGTLDVALEEDSVDMDFTSITVVQEEYRYSEDLWLVESDGKLLLAVLRSYGGVKLSYWNFCRFDWSRKDWTRVLGLGNHVLIFRQRVFNSSVSIACPPSGEESKFAMA
ncbi:hypothetical protein M0R45_020338 [Rubus argutus]|uniref:F-box domain-containing protein n=1 Tax=Rubus argutus TaxID=59490 RepID=A0AAW1X9Q9_RUBAR